jgi:hypothetical protein
MSFIVSHHLQDMMFRTWVCVGLNLGCLDVWFDILSQYYDRNAWSRDPPSLSIFKQGLDRVLSLSLFLKLMMYGLLPSNECIHTSYIQVQHVGISRGVWG